MLSIVTVSYNCKDFIELLVKSVRRFTTWPHELIVIDNNSEDGSREWLESQPNIRLAPLTTNIGHGRGLDMALGMAEGDFCLVLDADSHIQRNEYECDLLAYYRSGPNVRLVAALGTYDPDAPDAKPIHAAFMFFETQVFKDFGFSFVATGRHDVGRKVFYDLRERGLETVRIASGPKIYPGAYGCEYHINEKPTLYHNWYSSRMWHKDLVDNYKRADFDQYKAALFAQPLVREILGGTENGNK